MCTKEDSVYGKETNRFNRKENRTDGKEGRGQGTGRIINLGLTFRIFQATDCLQEEKGGRRIESINFIQVGT